MTDEIKKCYKFLNLPYDATIDQLKDRESTLIKYYKKKSKDTNTNNKEKIMFVRTATNKIYESILNNDKEKHTFFSTLPSEIIFLLFVLFVNCFLLVTLIVSLL